MTTNRLETSIALFDRVLSTLPKEDLPAFTSAVFRRLRESQVPYDGHNDGCGCGHDHHHHGHEHEEPDVIDQVIKELRAIVPVSAEAPGEEGKHLVPAGGRPESSRATAHVDAFLYDDDDVDELVDAGALTRQCCADCGSHRLRPLELVSHSASRAQLEFVFGPGALMRGAAARDRMRGALVVDVGSRLGAVLFVAWARTEAREIVGVESSAFFCGVQRTIAEEKFPQMAQRVRVVEGDVRDQGQLLARADVVVLNNPFEYFVGTPQDELSLWQFIRRSVSKRGAKVVAMPSLEETFARLGKDCADSLGLHKWVKKIAVEYPPTEKCKGDAGEDLRNVHLYVVQ